MSESPAPLTCWIVEDEPPARRRLEQLLARVRPGLEVAFAADTVADVIEAVGREPAPDLIFSDIQLADGLSFEAWAEAPPPCPVVFVTAYDQYAVRAFEVNSVDYLLKPVEEERLATAIDKFEQLRRADVPAVDLAALSALVRARRPNYRERFVLQHRGDYVAVAAADFAHFYSADGMTFGLTHARQRYLLPDTLDRLTEQLDPAAWFRINRAQIVSAAAVERASPYFNHRLSLSLKPATDAVDGIVARGKVKGFLAWWGGGG